ncbi:MAG TPA: glycosyltransferase family 2 protein [Methylomirabilota bacterium]|nr:glycosyltransferase family 2 protein [Methylomirabilota bacterium]
MIARVLVPAYDEVATIADVVRRARVHAPVLVVDDGSTDGTGAAAAAAGAEVLRHARRLGKAQALRTGFAAARGRGATHVVTLDADGQHAPDEIPALLAAAGPRTLVVGTRPIGNGALPPGRAEAIVVAGFFVNWASGLRLADTQSGFRVYPLALFDEVPARHGGFVFETEVLLAAAARGWTVCEIPVRALPRVAARSRFRPVADGVAIGAHLGGRALARGAAEAAAAVGAVLSIFERERRRARHAAMFEGAAPYTGTIVWSLALGAVATRRAGACLAGWWRHPRRRRATATATATLGLPIVVPLLTLTAVAGRRLPATRALVDALYAQDRLDAPPVAREPVTA